MREYKTSSSNGFTALIIRAVLKTGYDIAGISPDGRRIKRQLLPAETIGLHGTPSVRHPPVYKRGGRHMAFESLLAGFAMVLKNADPAAALLRLFFHDACYIFIIFHVININHLQILRLLVQICRLICLSCLGGKNIQAVVYRTYI